MGESVEDRAGMLLSLSKLDPQPESVPINALVAVEGTPLEEQEVVPVWEVVRMIATTRIVMPMTTVRLSAGRTEMSTEAQALCFMAGASSIFAGEKLLTTPNPGEDRDAEMFRLLGLTPTEKKKDNTGKFKIRRSIVEQEENQKWSRPGHLIARNMKAAEAAKELRKELRDRS